MCGIAGIVGQANSERIRPMTRTLAHRGPDEEGYFSTHFAALGHRRLKIIDLETGQQPMSSADGRHTLVFNGEIYNFLELRRILEDMGVEFRSNCDTEVILAAYQRWGIEGISRLNGMFAIALWDSDRKELIMARDRLGKKPLFYFNDGQSLVFASEIKAILAALDQTPEIDFAAISDYLTYLYIPYPRTIFRNIRQVPPATWIRVKVRPHVMESESRQYWSPLEGSDVPRSSSQAAGYVRERVANAVRSRMLADVPLGVLLSGGMDSSTITAIMAETNEEPVRSFSIGFSRSAAYDEIPSAQRVARRFGCEHQVLEGDTDCSAHLAKIVSHFDQPFGNPTAVLTYLLSALMKDHVTVALSGDGGDELFGGYPRYMGAYMSSLPRALPGFLRNRLLPGIGDAMTDDTEGRHQARRLREFLAGCGMPLIEMYLRWVGYFSPEEKRDFCSPGFLARTADHDSGAFLRAHYTDCEGLDAINRLAYTDIKSFLCCNVLEYADRMSMAHALELRAPFTDHRLVELSMRTPFHHKFRYGESKWILKQAMKPLLPNEVLNKRKLGFNPPVGSWLKGGLRDLPWHLLGTRQIETRGLFQPEAVRSMLELQASGRRDYSLRIWALMILEIWFRIYIDGLPVDTVQEQLDRAMARPTTSLVAV